MLLIQKTKTPANHCLQGLLIRFGKINVELEGVEPSSKQGTNKPSSCLVCYWFSNNVREQTPKSLP